MWRCRSVAPWHSPCPWTTASDEREIESERMSVTDTSPPRTNTTTKLALTAPASTPPNRESVSDVVRAWMGSGLDADGGIDDDSMAFDPETALSRITEVNDHLIQIGYANHLIVLAAVAILNESDVRPVKTGRILRVANRMATETVFNRPNIENSLSKLYGDDDTAGFVDRHRSGNAYDWYVTEQGRDVLAFLYELGIVEALAESGLTADID